MAFTSGSVANVGALFTAISTFLQANGWTQDHAAADRLLIHKGNLYPSFRWAAATPANVGIYHALGFVNSGTDPGNHTDDSGQGVVTGVEATLATGRHVPLVDATMAYWIFEDTPYAHVVVRVGANDYRHFGMGLADKAGDGFTGGEYVYGWRWNFASTDVDDLAVRQDSSTLLDGLGNELAFAASVHIESVPNQAAGKWGVVGDLASAGNDRGASARSILHGGFRTLLGRHLGWSSHSDAGHLINYAIPFFAKVNSGADLYLLGHMPDVRAVDLSFFAAEQVVTFGSEDWQFFPTKARGAWDGVMKSTVTQGIAYKLAP